VTGEPVEIELRGHDFALRAWLLEPTTPTPNSTPLNANVHHARATVLLCHAALASSSTFRYSKRNSSHRSLMQTLAAAGYRVFTFDFRGHGRSPGKPNYDAHIQADLPLVFEHLRTRFPGSLFAVGHSLGGHTLLAAAALKPKHAPDGLVMLGANLWDEASEPDARARRLKRIAERAITMWIKRDQASRATLMDRVMQSATPSVPSLRAHRDVLLPFFRAREAWRSERGADYDAAVRDCSIPVCTVVSEGDTLTCTVASGFGFTQRARGARQCFVLTRRGEKDAPSHMGLARSTRAWSFIEKGLVWLESVNPSVVAFGLGP
jgi:pimeloyl-ACP methyl ester carboxylesterase